MGPEFSMRCECRRAVFGASEVLVEMGCYILFSEDYRIAGWELGSAYVGRGSGVGIKVRLCCILLFSKYGTEDSQVRINMGCWNGTVVHLHIGCMVLLVVGSVVYIFSGQAAGSWMWMWMRFSQVPTRCWLVSFVHSSLLQGSVTKTGHLLQ